MESRALFGKAIEQAIKVGASDIIFSVNSAPCLKSGGKIVFLELDTISDTTMDEIVKLIIPAAKKKELDYNKQCDFAYEIEKNRFRMNVFNQRGHLSMVMRYIKPDIPSLESLGLPEIVKELIKHDNGLILMVGPTGSGKSTSLAAMIDYLNHDSEKHIITIEDPIEYIYENDKCLIEQREIGIDAIDFSSALRSALREAPDVVLLGEMRDLESISTAITVAETGHLVFSTIHANSAVATIDRIIDIFPESNKDQIRIQLSDILIAVLNQRLVPKEDGGYKLVLEIMIANSAVRNAIRTANSAQLPTIIQTSSVEGMCLMDDQLIRAVARGEISKENALAFAQDRATLRKGL